VRSSRRNPLIRQQVASIIEVRLSFNSRFDPAMHELLPLHLLAPGTRAVIGQLVGGADEVHRLEELGMRAGTQVEMVQSGSPCIIRLGGAKICFRDNEAVGVLVRTGDAA
jgi:ferrous iron transport protein A